MEEVLNVTETPVIPEAPSTVANEQLYIYIPIATEDDYGAVKIGEDLLVDADGRLQVFFNPDKVVTLIDEQRITGKKIFDNVDVENFASENSNIDNLTVKIFKAYYADIDALSISTAPKNDNDVVRLRELHDAAVKGIVVPFNLEKGAGLDSIVQKVSLIGEPDDENFANTATGVGAVTFGKSNKNSGPRSFVDGLLNVNEGENSVLIGYNLYNKRANAAIFGYNNLYNADVIFGVGNGASDVERRNAFVVMQDGRAKVQSAPIENDDVVRLLELNVLKDQINAVNGIKYKEVVSKLPTVGDEYTLYFLTRSNGSYDEYLYIDGTWELIGGGNNVNLDNAVTTDTEQTITAAKYFYNGRDTTSIGFGSIYVEAELGSAYTCYAVNEIRNANFGGYGQYTFTFPNKSGVFALTSDIPTDYVTTDTEQDIVGHKYFRGTFAIKEWEGDDNCEIQEDGTFIITIDDYYNAFIFPLNPEKTTRMLATTEEVDAVENKLPIIVRW